MVHAYLNEIGTAVPENECQQECLATLSSWIPDPAVADKLRVIAKRSGIERRHTVLNRVIGARGSGAFFKSEISPARRSAWKFIARKLPAWQ